MPKLHPELNDNDHQQGNKNAKVVLVEYGDYQCPYCGAAHPVVKRIQEEMGDDLLFVFRNFPLTNIHPRAMLAAVSTEAAARQDFYWEMHDHIFEHQDSISYPYLTKFAGDSGLNADQFKQDLENQGLKDKVETDFESGMRSGVNRTPSFFINGIKHEGWTTYEGLITAIKAALEE